VSSLLASWPGSLTSEKPLAERWPPVYESLPSSCLRADWSEYSSPCWLYRCTRLWSGQLEHCWRCFDSLSILEISRHCLNLQHYCLQSIAFNRIPLCVCTWHVVFSTLVIVNELIIPWTLFHSWAFFLMPLHIYDNISFCYATLTDLIDATPLLVSNLRALF
jgi:hypothetical protein